MAASFDTVYAFHREHYKHGRFEGRNGEWCPDYSQRVVRSALKMIAELGVGCIGQYESVTGKAIWFDADLRILEEEEVRALLRASAGK